MGGFVQGFRLVPGEFDFLRIGEAEIAEHHFVKAQISQFGDNLYQEIQRTGGCWVEPVVRHVFDAHIFPQRAVAAAFGQAVGHAGGLVRQEIPAIPECRETGDGITTFFVQIVDQRRNRTGINLVCVSSQRGQIEKLTPDIAYVNQYS